MTTPIRTLKKKGRSEAGARTIQKGAKQSVSVSVSCTESNTETMKEFETFWKEHRQLSLMIDTESFARIAYFNGRASGLATAIKIIKE